MQQLRHGRGIVRDTQNAVQSIYTVIQKEGIMKVINVTLNVNKNMQQDYKEFIATLVKKSRQESGNISYDHYKSLTVPDEYQIIEHWQDEEAINFHNETEHFKTFLTDINIFLDRPLEIIVMDYK